MKLHQIAIAIFVINCNYEINVHGYTIESANCGRRLVNHEPLIVDGSTSTEGSWPWHANILHIDIRLNIQFKCVGNILNSNAILTAAHCVFENGQPIVPYRVFIQLGRNNLKISGPNSQEFEAFRVIPHPSFNSADLRNDIAIILLATKITFNNYIQPICLWNANEFDLSEVIGKPVTKTDRISYTLQEAVMPVVSLGTCLSSDYGFYGQFLSDYTFCAGFRNGTTACNGDSGGSLVFAEEGVYRIRGIVSLTQARREERQELCKVDEYVVFTDVAMYLSWIEENVPSLPPKRSIDVASSNNGVISETLFWNETWAHGSWALGCEFPGNDFQSVQTTGEECAEKCASTPQCTHFTWYYGTCWMKQNAISKSNAIVTSDKTGMCGVVSAVTLAVTPTSNLGPAWLERAIQVLREQIAN